MKQVLLIIDLQNDYFPGYKFPLWNTTDVLHRILHLIDHAKQKEIPIVLIQHVADVSLGFAPFFVPGTEGVEIKKEVLDKFTNPIIVQKAYADGFVKTDLTETLKKLQAEELLVCGMMTQNCVTFTSTSPMAAPYKVKVITDCCTTVDQMIHLIAIAALSTRVEFVTSDKI